MISDKDIDNWFTYHTPTSAAIACNSTADQTLVVR